MPNYRLFAEGYNYPGHNLGFDGQAGFYITIYVRALKPTLAEYEAMKKVRDIKSFKDINDSEKEDDNRAYVTFSSIEQIEMLPRNRTSTLHSYPMDEPNTAFIRNYNRSTHHHLNPFPWKGKTEI